MLLANQGFPAVWKAESKRPWSGIVVGLHPAGRLASPPSSASCCTTLGRGEPKRLKRQSEAAAIHQRSPAGASRVRYPVRMMWNRLSRREPWSSRRSTPKGLDGGVQCVGNLQSEINRRCVVALFHRDDRLTADVHRPGKRLLTHVELAAPVTDSLPGKITGRVGTNRSAAPGHGYCSPSVSTVSTLRC